LHTLDIKEIENMMDIGQNELVCHYCNKHYYITEAEFTGILQKVKAGKN
jgi:redox-regulated HSP33 family molecular chaperone